MSPLVKEITDLVKKDQRTGIKVIDNMICDALGEERMATREELRCMINDVVNKDFISEVNNRFNLR